MPTNRRRRIRNRKQTIGLDDSVRDCLLYGTAESGTPGYDLRCSRFFDGGETLRQAWRQHEQELLKEWHSKKHSGEPWVLAYLRRAEKIFTKRVR